MNEPDGIQIALQHYRTKWLTAWTADDWSGIATEWQTEYDAVASGALDSTLITQASFEGGGANAQKNFEQSVRLRALQLFRAEMDEDYAPVLAPPAAVAPRRLGTVLRFSP